MESHSPVKITHLRCEYLLDALGIDARSPRLSWVQESERRGERQTAYQILVAASEAALARDHGDLWDSGRVASSQMQVSYAGRSPSSGQACWWKVRVWDGDDQPSVYSLPARWEMGLLDDADWHAQWIGSPEADLPDLQPSPYLRTTFSVTRLVRSARVYVTARGLYELHLNGARIGDAVLSPGWTDYNTRIQYQTYDVTDLIQSGENAIGALLGAGWYAGYVGFDHSRALYGSRLELLLQLRLVYADGTEDWLVSDDLWRFSTIGAIRSSDLLMGEVYDARMELTGWDTAEYDDSAWGSVAVRARDSARLVADCAEPVRVTETIRPKAITQPAEGVYVVDLGQNIAGWARLRVQGAAGAQVMLRFAEMLNPDGTIYTENLRDAKPVEKYTLKGGAEETYEPHFTFHGFRYVEVTGCAPTLDSLIGCVVHSDTPPAGSFECSNGLVNQLYRNIVWGQRGNFLSVPTDCPQRDERLGWMGDAQVFVRTAACNRDVAAFFSKWMIDVEDAQSPRGAFPDIAPRAPLLSDGATAWGDAGVIIPYTIWQVYGDTQIVERHWAAMERWMRYLHDANPGLLRVARRNRDYGDWLAVKAEMPKEVLATAYFAYDARLMARMAAAVGREADAARYNDLFEAIKSAFMRAYVSDDGHVRGDTQTAYALALYMDLLPDDLRAAAAKHLVERIHERGDHISTGFVGVSYLCPVLTAAGALDLAYCLLTNDTYPSWGYSIRHGATTIWERWDGWTEASGFQDPKMNSFNHYAFGSVGQWLFQTVAGIDTDADHPGFERILIHPQPGGGLTSARAEYDSVRGRIVSDWRVEDGTFTLDVTIPANATALVTLPCGDELRESGEPLDQAAGVTRVSQTQGATILSVAAGSYRFSGQMKP